MKPAWFAPAAIIVAVALSGSAGSACTSESASVDVAATIAAEPVTIGSETESPGEPKDSTGSSPTPTPTPLSMTPESAKVFPTGERCATVSAERSAAPVVVKLWNIFGGTIAPTTFSDLVTSFNESQSQVRLEVTAVGGAAEMLRRLQESPESKWPDIVMATPQSLKRLVDTGRIIAPGECADGERITADLLPVVRSSYSLRGQLQAFPYGVSTTVLMFDAAEFARAGLDPQDPPSTLDELRAASKQVVDTGVSPYGLVLSKWTGHYLINQGAAQRGAVIAEPDNGHSGGPIGVDYDTPENRDAIDWMHEVMTEAGGVWIGLTPSGLEDLTRIVAPTDGAVMTLHSTGSLGDVIAILDTGSFPTAELGVGAMPGPAPGGLIGGNGLWIVDHGDPERAGAAFEAIRWLTDRPNLARFDAATGYIPPTLAVAAEPVVAAAWAEHPQLRIGWEQVRLLSADAASAGAAFGPNSEIDELLFALSIAVVEQGESAANVLPRLTDAANALLRNYDALVVPSGG